MSYLSSVVEKELFWGNMFFECVYFILSLVFEDRFSNVLILPFSKDYPVTTISDDTLKERIIIMSNAHLIRIMFILLIIIIYFILLYVHFLISKVEDFSLRPNIDKGFFLNFYLIIIIAMVDICPCLFIYPYISKYTSIFCMPVHWNISQYLLILTIVSKICSYDFNKKAFFNSIIISIISFIIQVYSFSNYYFTRNTEFTNYFNNTISILIFFFAPMLIFVKEYLVSYLIIKPYNDYVSFLLIISTWIFEEIIYLVLRIIFVSPHNLFFGGGHLMESIFAFLLITIHDIVDVIFLLDLEINLATKGFAKSISHLMWWLLNCVGFWVAYKPFGYVLFTILTTVIDLLNYVLLITLQTNVEVFNNMYDVDLYFRPKYVNDDKKTINLPSVTQTNSNYNQNENNCNFYENKINELKNQKYNLKNSKSSLESQISSIRNSNIDLKSEVETLKIKNKKLKDENGRLINEYKEKEKLVDELKKKNK